MSQCLMLRKTTIRNSENTEVITFGKVIMTKILSETSKREILRRKRIKIS